MLHEISRMVGGGQERQSESADVAREMRHTQNHVIELFCKRTGIDIKRLNKAIARKDLYLSAKEALDWGIIDGIIGTSGVPCPRS